MSIPQQIQGVPEQDQKSNRIDPIASYNGYRTIPYMQTYLLTKDPDNTPNLN